jgi:hypothetical protein
LHQVVDGLRERLPRQFHWWKIIRERMLQDHVCAGKRVAEKKNGSTSGHQLRRSVLSLNVEAADCGSCANIRNPLLKRWRYSMQSANRLDMQHGFGGFASAIPERPTAIAPGSSRFPMSCPGRPRVCQGPPCARMTASARVNAPAPRSA